MEEGIMLTSLDAEGMKKDQLHVENTDGVSPYFNKIYLSSCKHWTEVSKFYYVAQLHAY